MFAGEGPLGLAVSDYETAGGGHCGADLFGIRREGRGRGRLEGDLERGRWMMRGRGDLLTLWRPIGRSIHSNQ